ncbi:MAG: Maf-like protein [Hoylesella marshii]|uniref:Maf-like protein n=1 Tax=Hoylesella marshii TaxID=189722 RepID=UPI003FA15269
MQTVSYKMVLASNSPRRRELLAGLDIPFEVRVADGIDESYPETIPAHEVARYIAGKKAAAYCKTIADDELVITADTVVVVGEKVLGKPKDAEEACSMLRELSGKIHRVITGVCLITRQEKRLFDVTTYVTFKPLTEEEIRYYVNRYRPMDKAGAYGVQEWIGYIGVTNLSGSYYNVMGLPVQRIYQELNSLTGGIR